MAARKLFTISPSREAGSKDLEIDYLQGVSPPQFAKELRERAREIANEIRGIRVVIITNDFNPPAWAIAMLMKFIGDAAVAVLDTREHMVLVYSQRQDEFGVGNYFPSRTQNRMVGADRKSA